MRTYKGTPEQIMRKRKNNEIARLIIGFLAIYIQIIFYTRFPLGEILLENSEPFVVLIMLIGFNIPLILGIGHIIVAYKRLSEMAKARKESGK